MRRALAIFLLVLLPLQFGWSAAAAYCAHETGSDVVGHFGHHAHQHQGEAEGDGHDAGATKAPGSVDLDCSQCHGHGTGMLAVWPALTSSLAAALPAAGAEAVAAPGAPARPERPQWAALA